MTRFVFIALLLLTQFLPLTDAQKLAETPLIGGVSFAADGSLAHFKIADGGADIAVKGDYPWSFLTAANGQQKSVRIDKIAVVASSAKSVTLSLASSMLPGAAATVEINAADSQSLKFTVMRVSGAAVSGIAAQFLMPDDFDCQLGNPAYSPAHHSCSSVKSGTAAAFCVSGNCENTVMFDAALVPRIGASLTKTPLQDLAGSSFIIFTTPAYIQTLDFLRDFRTFRQKYGSQAASSSAIFFISLPNSAVDNNQINLSGIRSAAQIAKDSGFGEVLLEGGIWLKTTGEFDARSGLSEAVKEFKNNGLTTVLHTLASELNPYNRLCTPNPPLAGIAVREYKCPNKTAQTDFSGKSFINDYGTNYLWDGNQRSVFDRVVNSYINGVKQSGAGGIYADGADWFARIDPNLGPTYLAEIANRAPDLRLRAAISGSRSALHIHDVDWTDAWQIAASHTPKDWVFNTGYATMQGWHDQLGIGGRLGWIPPPRAGDTPESYLPLFSAAVATGSFVTIETAGDDPAWSAPSFLWFRTGLRETLEAVREIRAAKSEGMPVIRTARFELTHFSNGVSTVALFDSIIPAAADSRIEARSYGVRIDKNGNCRIPSSGCFYFKGTPRLPVSPNTPRLSDGGSFLFAPGDTATRTKNFTLAAWFKPEQTASSGGLFEKTTFGYGLYLANGEIGGHTTGAVMGNFYNNPYLKLDNPTAWNHIIYSYRDQERRVKCYLNGKLLFDLPFTNSPPLKVFADAPIYVGTTGDAQSNFRGWLDNITLYDRDLSDSEANTLFTSNAATGKPLISWSAANSAPKIMPVLDIPLATQRVVYLVPLLEGTRLPPERIRLTFNGLRGKAATAQIQTSLKFRRTQPDANTIVVEIDAADINQRINRLAISER